MRCNSAKEDIRVPALLPCNKVNLGALSKLLQNVYVIYYFYVFAIAFIFIYSLSVVQAAVSIKRINKYMNSEDLDPSSVSHDDKEGE